ncbi:hypothetical protein ADM96_15595 [Burkholderia sp. ST111]|nr:hypothetical protein ADM96_15595 [Burkholderia sp. ST111]
MNTQAAAAKTTTATAAKKTSKKMFEGATEPVTVIEATPAAGHALPANPVACLTTERSGAFTFTTAATALHDAHVAVRPAPASAKAPAARVSRDRFDDDTALISFIAANQWNDKKTQWILDNIRKAVTHAAWPA